MIEDVFALAVPLQIGGHGGQQRAVLRTDNQRCGLPAGAGTDAARIFQRSQEFMANEGVVRSRQGVPFGALESADRTTDAGGQVARRASLAHATPSPSAIGASACNAAISRSVGVSTVQVSTGRPASRNAATIGLGRAATW